MDQTIEDQVIPRSLETGAQAREYRQIQSQLKRGGFWLRFPQPLEQQFCLQHDTMAVATFNSTVSWALGLYVFLGVAVLRVMDSDQLGFWPASYTIFLFFIVSGWLMSFSELACRH